MNDDIEVIIIMEKGELVSVLSNKEPVYLSCIDTDDDDAQGLLDEVETRKGNAELVEVDW